MFKDYEMILYVTLGVLFALSVLVAVLDKKISHGIFFFLSLFVLSIFFFDSRFLCASARIPNDNERNLIS